MSSEYGDIYESGHPWSGDEAPSISLIAKWHDEGRTCAECAEEFTQPHGHPVVCQHCKNQGSELPQASHPERSKEEFANRARKRRKAKESK